MEMREQVAGMFGRGDLARMEAELARLDRTQHLLTEGEPADIARARIHQQGVWQARFEALLEDTKDAERERVAGELQALVHLVVSTAGGDAAMGTGKATARDGGRATTGVRRTGISTGLAVAVNTGDAEATGKGSEAVSGILST
ncbi:hypothetical protein [Streptomyces sp. JH34]|uniref:hypothetical protein n=1 Tax=Streptomyces sp. JH34 TaxID=2793633 RepID=UPI0023F66F1D|nr:hypothetical protein [Streptomyces sp. JH34]MDF6020950.1 hypothetical protein [Streptomyces sp. JH34]